MTILRGAKKSEGRNSLNLEPQSSFNVKIERRPLCHPFRQDRAAPALSPLYDMIERLPVQVAGQVIACDMEHVQYSLPQP